MIALFTDLSGVSDANATISSYDATLDVYLTFALPPGVTASNDSFVFTASTSGSGGATASFATSSVPPELAMILHAFGTGTGSSLVDAVESIDIHGPPTYLFEVQFVIDTGSLSASADLSNGGFAQAFLTRLFDVEGPATRVLCPPDVFAACFEAHDTVTARLEGVVSGLAITAVFEPATLALLGIGFAGIGFSSLRKATKRTY